MAKNQEKTRPVDEVRISGIKAAIWKNQGEKGPWYNVTFQKLYKDQGGEWKGVSAFGRDDLLLLAKVANQAHTRLLEILADERPKKRAADTHESEIPI